MNGFIIFVAPFIILIVAVWVAFYVGPKDKLVNKDEV